MESHIQKNRAYAVFEVGRAINQAMHQVYEALQVLNVENDSRGYMELVRKELQEAQLYVGQSEEALRMEQKEEGVEYPEDTLQNKEKKAISMGEVTACIAGFLCSGKRHLELYLTPEGLCWRGLNGRTEREFIEEEVFWIPNAIHRRQEELVYTFVTIIQNKERYILVSSLH